MAGMVVCIEPIAARIGRDVLARGGNAVDAAVAAAIAQGVTNPINCGIGGHGVMVIHQAKERKQEVINFWGTIGTGRDLGFLAENYLGRGDGVTNARRFRIKGDPHLTGHTSVLVPGEVRGLNLALTKYGSGKLSWGDLLEPAIRVAEDGFDIYPALAQGWQPDGPLVEGTRNRLGRIQDCAASAAIFTKQGRALEPGDRLVLKDYARTLRRLAEHGADEFYTGEIGHRIAADFKANGGFLTSRDLAEFQPYVCEPVRGRYRAYDVVSDTPPGSGALVIALLQAAERLGVGHLGWNSPTYIDHLARLFRLVFTERERYMGDPRFIEVPVADLVAPAHADELAATIRAGDDLGVPAAPPMRAAGTTHLSVVDGDGNAVGVTHTLGSTAGTSTPGLGFLYNNDMHVFDPVPGHPNSVEPGKQPVNGGGPTLLFEDGEIRVVIGSPNGARKVTAIVQALMNVFEHGMSMAGAVTAPRIHAEDEARVVVLEPSFPLSLERDLQAMGYRVLREPQGARLSAILRHRSGALEGGADPRGGGGLASLD